MYFLPDQYPRRYVNVQVEGMEEDRCQKNEAEICTIVISMHSMMSVLVEFWPLAD